MEIILTLLCWVDSATSTLWTGYFPTEGVSGWFLVSLCFIEIPVFNANIVDPNQTLRSVASDLGLYCLPMSLVWDTRHNWIKYMLHIKYMYGLFTLLEKRIVCLQTNNTVIT